MLTRQLMRAVLRGSLAQVRHVRAVPVGRAEGLVAEVYARTERDFGVLAPPVALHSPAPLALAASWLLLRETLLVEGRVGRAVKEAVATAVSQANACPYCVEVHQAKLQTLLEPGGPPDSSLTRIADWVRTGGRTTEEGLPFSSADAPEILGVAVTFHYLNRMVSVFLDSSPLPSAAPAAVKGPALRTVAKAMIPDGRKPLTAGTSLDLLPGAPLPAGLSWAVAEPAVAQALARATAATDAAADRWVPGTVQDLLHTHLADWDGNPPALGRAWLEAALPELPAAHRPLARLALLTARTPQQVSDADVAAFRVFHPGDQQLVELASWAALTTAARIGVLLGDALATGQAAAD